MPDNCRICGRADGAGLADLRMTSLRYNLRALPLTLNNNTDAPLATRCLVRKDQTLDMRLRPDRQVCAVFRWRRRKALDVFQRQPERWFTSSSPTPSLSPLLKSSERGMPASTAASAKFEDIPFQPLLLDAPFAAMAYMSENLLLPPVFGHTCAMVQPVVVLILLEIGQAILPRPGIVAPICVCHRQIACLTTHIDHAVDRRAATQASYREDSVANDRLIRRPVRFVKPVCAWVADTIKDTRPGYVSMGSLLPGRLPATEHVLTESRLRRLASRRPARSHHNNNVVKNVVEIAGTTIPHRVTLQSRWNTTQL